MNQAPFNIGRLLSLADQLHYLYCQEVRGNQLPPQLLGNALMNTALQQPVTALALFAQRILPYQAWAKTFRKDEKASDEEQKKVRKARYLLREIGDVSETLHKAKFQPRLSDEDRAGMILGYLAGTKWQSAETPQGN